MLPVILGMGFLVWARFDDYPEGNKENIKKGMKELFNNIKDANSALNKERKENIKKGMKEWREFFKRRSRKDKKENTRTFQEHPRLNIYDDLERSRKVEDDINKCWAWLRTELSDPENPDVRNEYGEWVTTDQMNERSIKDYGFPEEKTILKTPTRSGSKTRLRHVRFGPLLFWNTSNKYDTSIRNSLTKYRNLKGGQPSNYSLWISQDTGMDVNLVRKYLIDN